MNSKILPAGLFFLLFTCFSCRESDKSFSFVENEEGVELREGRHPVFFYQRKPKSRNGKYICSNYIHPLYSLDGDTLTQEFPADHPYHRGIFWAWHQHYVGDRSIGDGWIMQDVSYDVENVQVKTTKDKARITLHVFWRSSSFRNGAPYMEEVTNIIVYPVKNQVRKIDFTISLTALVPGVSVGGSDDEKGYGGFCCRIRMPEGLIFTSSGGETTPQRLQVKAGPWMDFSAPFGKHGEISGLTLLCHESDPGYPQPWILRQKGSMQNIVFPGRKKIHISAKKPTVLRYRLIIHRGNARDINIPKLQKEYNRYLY